MNYLIQSSICLAICYGFYFLFFRKDTFFQRNRLYLNVALVISLVIPLIQLPQLVSGVASTAFLEPLMLIQPTLESSAENILLLEELTITAQGADKWFTNFSFFALTYFTVAMLLFAKLLFSFGKILWFIFAHNTKRLEDYTLVYTEGNLPTFSFFRYMFWDNSVLLSAEEERQVKAHELAHIRGNHSVDLLFVELYKVVFWFNPVVYFLHRALVNQHEFIADRSVLTYTEFKTYARFVVQSIFQNTSLRVVHNFNQSQLKTRIDMMKKNATPKMQMLKVVFTLPLVGLLLFMFSCEDDYLVSDDKATQPNISFENKLDFDNAEVLRKVDQYAKPIGGFSALHEKLTNEMAIPEGQAVRVNFEFIISSEGRLSNARVLGNSESAKKIQNQMITILKNVEWEPAMLNGKSVNQSLILPIRITSKEEYEKMKSESPDVLAKPKTNFKEILQEIKANLVYPTKAKEAGLEGKVFIKFIIDETGKLTNLHVVRGLSRECDQAALDAFKAVEVEWTPAEKDNKKISQEMILPIAFSLNEGELQKQIFSKEDIEKTTQNTEAIVDVNAKPEGGMPVLIQALAKNLIYPSEAREAGLEGKVFMQFTIDTKGNLQDIKAVKGFDEACKKAAVEALSSLAIQWTPAEKDGKLVNQRMVLPVNFKID